MSTRVAARRRRSPLIARESWLVGGIAAVVVVGILIANSGTGRGFYEQSDSPLFLGVARWPFGTGRHFPGQPLVQGVAYRYGRVFFPLTGWLLAFGRASLTKWSLAAVYVGSFGAWVSLAGEHLRRGARSPHLALWIFTTPWALLWFIYPAIVSEPMAGALLLLGYLYEREGKHGSARVVATLAILTRELMIIAFLPVAWRAWKERRWAAARDWALVVMPYVCWTVWVRFRVGQFPFLDPATSRRDALALPFVGWYRTMVGPLDNGAIWGVVIGAVTVVAVALVALRGNWIYPVTHGVVALGLLSLCYGVSVFKFPGEALRVMVPMQMLLFIAALSRRPALKRT